MFQPGIPARLPRWTRLVVIVAALLSAAGAALALVHPASLVAPGVEMNSGVRVFAGYFVARSFAFAALLLFLLLIGANRALGYVMALIGLIQFADAIMDLIEGRWPILPGVLVMGVLFLLAAGKLCGAPFWRRRAWLE